MRFKNKSVEACCIGCSWIVNICLVICIVTPISPVVHVVISIIGKVASPRVA